MRVLDSGYVKLIDTMPSGSDMDRAVTNAARVSYGSKSHSWEGDKKLLKYLYEHRHTTPFEHAVFKFKVKAPIFVARQWMRHRTWSFNEISRRYTSNDIEFYIPDEWRLQDSDNKQGSYGIAGHDEKEAIGAGLSTSTHLEISDILKLFTEHGTEIYHAFIGAGISREMARMFLPVNMYTEFYATVDAHNLMHFLRLRMDEHAQWEIRQYANALFYHFDKKMPETAKLFKNAGEGE